MSRMHKLTCGFEELSLSVLEMEGNVEGAGGHLARSPFLHALFLCQKIIRLATNFSQKICITICQ